MTRRPRTIWLSDEEWGAIHAAAQADTVRVQDFMREAIAVQVDGALDTPIPLSQLAARAPRSHRGRPPLEIEWSKVDDALRRANGSQRGAARILGLSQSTLNRRLRRRTRLSIVDAATRP